VRESFGRAATGWSVQRGNFLADDRIVRRFVNVDLCPVRMFFGHSVVGKNCFDGAFRHTGIAIDARIGVDIKTIRQLMKRFDRTNGSAVRVFTINAHFYNNVGHSRMTPFTEDKCLLFNGRNVNKKMFITTATEINAKRLFALENSRFMLTDQGVQVSNTLIQNREW
jgi:hypothetical protein